MLRSESVPDIAHPMTPHDPWLVRPTEVRDIPALYVVRASTRQNAITAETLIGWGITPESTAEGLASGEFHGMVCEAQGKVVGFCTGDTRTGEVLVLAVLPEFEGKGIGSTLLRSVVAGLSECQIPSLWLACSPDPASRSHGFYRAQGWVANGKTLDNGDEILELER